MITIRNINKYFNRGRKNELHVLNGINVEFEDRGLVCILGESGSGKTTLLNVIGGLDTFADGEMDIEGMVLKKYKPKEIEQIRNDKFGYIFQNYYLLQDYTVAYNVKLALNTFDISEEEKDKRVDYVLEKLNMLKYKKKLVSQLSGGQQQRVSIARALVRAPKIILADEPTGNLDEENTLRTMSILKNISKECLVILVSHEKRIASFFADRIIEIQDGRIIKDCYNQNADAYERMDDGNIYLKDLQPESLSERDGAVITLYQAPEDAERKICLNLAWNKGKLYIQNLSDCDILLAGQEAGCEMVDEHKPDIDMGSVEEFDYFLPHLKAKKAARLSMKEVWKLAVENISLMGKKQAFIMGILLVTAVMLTITLANFTNSYLFNEREVYKSDSHCVSVRVSPGYALDSLSYEKAFKKFCEEHIFQGDYASRLFKDSGSPLMMQYDGFAQLSSTGVEFKDFSYVPIEHLKKQDLIYGRMPEKSREIVVDNWLFERFFETDSPYKILFKESEDFLGIRLLANVSGDEFEIVGICDSGEPSIYISRNRVMGMVAAGDKIASIEELQAEYPGKYDNIVLKENEALVPKKEYELREWMKSFVFNTEEGREYKIVGSFSDELPVDFVFSEEGCTAYRNDYILASKGFHIYTDNPENTVKELKQYAEPYKETLIFEIENSSQKQLKEFEESRKANVTGRNLIAIAGSLISLFMIYFMIKSNVSSRIEELTVYRLVGIAKGSIIQAYLLEMLFVTSYTVLPAVLITSGVIKIIGSIPSLELGMAYPWWAAFLLIGAVYFLNLLISIIPVCRILSRPPATLAVKE